MHRSHNISRRRSALSGMIRLIRFNASERRPGSKQSSSLGARQNAPGKDSSLCRAASLICPRDVLTMPQGHQTSRPNRQFRQGQDNAAFSYAYAQSSPYSQLAASYSAAHGGRWKVTTLLFRNCRSAPIPARAFDQTTSTDIATVGKGRAGGHGAVAPLSTSRQPAMAMRPPTRAAYLNLTVSVSSLPQFGHSNVRLS